MTCVRGHSSETLLHFQQSTILSFQQVSVYAMLRPVAKSGHGLVLEAGQVSKCAVLLLVGIKVESERKRGI